LASFRVPHSYSNQIRSVFTTGNSKLSRSTLRPFNRSLTKVPVNLNKSLCIKQTFTNLQSLRIKTGSLLSFTKGKREQRYDSVNKSMRPLQSSVQALWVVAGVTALLYTFTGDVSAEERKEDSPENSKVESKKEESTELTVHHPSAVQETNITHNNKDTCLFAPLVLGIWERTLLFILAVGTAGFSYPILYPWFLFEHYRNAVQKIYLGGKRFKFTGDLWEFYFVHGENYVLCLITFGFYWLLGFSDLRVAKYLDSHIEMIEYTAETEIKVGKIKS